MDVVFAAWDDDAVEGGVKRGTLKSSTARSYRSCVRAHLLPAFRHVPAINSPRICSPNGAGRGPTTSPPAASPKTYNNLVNLLSAVLAWARKDAQRYHAQDPLAEIKAPNQTWSGRFLSRPDRSTAEGRHAAGGYGDHDVAVFAGLRRGELCALRWEDIDWGDGAHGRLLIRRAVSGGKVSTPKTKNSIRMIDVPAAVIANLRAYRRTCQDAPETAYLFRSAEGTPMDPDNLSKRIFLPLARARDCPASGCTL